MEISKIVKKISFFDDEKNRSKDLYLFNESNETVINTICIGLNPSARNDDFLDKTNMILVNHLINSKTSSFNFGYYLLNLCSEIEPDSKKLKCSKPNNLLLEFLKSHSDCNVILFYGRNATGNKYKKLFSEELIAELKKFIDNESLYITVNSKNKFSHPSKGSTNIVKFTNDSKNSIWPKKIAKNRF